MEPLTGKAEMPFRLLLLSPTYQLTVTDEIPSLNGNV